MPATPEHSRGTRTYGRSHPDSLLQGNIQQTEILRILVRLDSGRKSSPDEEQGQHHCSERCEPQEERAVPGTLLSDQGADYQNVHHRQCTQYEEANLRVTKHGPYHSQVECGDGDANHAPRRFGSERLSRQASGRRIPLIRRVPSKILFHCYSCPGDRPTRAMGTPHFGGEERTIPWHASSIRPRNPQDCATATYPSFVYCPRYPIPASRLRIPTAHFPLNLSPSTVSLYSTVMPSSIPANFRTAENVSVRSFSFRSLSFVSPWSGQLIVPASLSPSPLIFKVDVYGCPPLSYSHFHVPSGSATLSSAAPPGRIPRGPTPSRESPS